MFSSGIPGHDGNKPSYGWKFIRRASYRWQMAALPLTYDETGCDEPRAPHCDSGR